MNHPGFFMSLRAPLMVRWVRVVERSVGEAASGASETSAALSHQWRRAAWFAVVVLIGVAAIAFLMIRQPESDARCQAFKDSYGPGGAHAHELMSSSDYQAFCGPLPSDVK
jgi:hypothetical protein